MSIRRALSFSLSWTPALLFLFLFLFLFLVAALGSRSAASPLSRPSAKEAFAADAAVDAAVTQAERRGWPWPMGMAHGGMVSRTYTAVRCGSPRGFERHAIQLCHHDRLGVQRDELRNVLVVLAFLVKNRERSREDS